MKLFGVTAIWQKSHLVEKLFVSTINYANNLMDDTLALVLPLSGRKHEQNKIATELTNEM